MTKYGFVLVPNVMDFVLLCLQLDEKVREWQDTNSTASRCFWVTDQASWAELIPSAVRFLSDGILGKSFVFIFIICVLNSKRRSCGLSTW